MIRVGTIAREFGVAIGGNAILSQMSWSDHALAEFRAKKKGGPRAALQSFHVSYVVLEFVTDAELDLPQ